jgi:phage-related protein
VAARRDKTPLFSQAARVEAGVLLRQLQGGAKLGLPHSRPMPGIGARCRELRIVDEGATWRIIYRLDDDAVGNRRRFQQEDASDAWASDH